MSASEWLIWRADHHLEFARMCDWHRKISYTIRICISSWAERILKRVWKEWLQASLRYTSKDLSQIDHKGNSIYVKMCFSRPLHLFFVKRCGEIYWWWNRNTCTHNKINSLLRSRVRSQLVCVHVAKSVLKNVRQNKKYERFVIHVAKAFLAREFNSHFFTLFACFRQSACVSCYLTFSRTNFNNPLVWKNALWRTFVFSFFSRSPLSFFFHYNALRRL